MRTALLLLAAAAAARAQPAPAAPTQGCVFDGKCAAGERSAQKLDFQPWSNGCGSGGVWMTHEFDMAPCCHAHDACYGVCGVPKAACDRDFAQCMNRQCEGVYAAQSDACKSNSKIMLLGVQNLGCRFYLDGQAEACACVAGEDVEAYTTQQVIDFYATYNPDKLKADEDRLRVQERVREYAGREAGLLYKLHKRYPESIDTRSDVSFGDGDLRDKFKKLNQLATEAAQAEAEQAEARARGAGGEL